MKIGLTGGIGAGKSTVAARLRSLGAVIVDADQLARDVVEPGTDGLAAVVDAFGPQILTADGALDRAALGRRVFADAADRERLNSVLHPRIAALTAERMTALGPERIIVHDVPLLVENRLGAGYHLVIVVHAPAAERLRRLVTDRGMDPGQATARIGAQADDVQRRAAADVWLDNTGAPPRLTEAVDRVWRDRLLPYQDNLLAHRAQTPGPHPDRAPNPDRAPAPDRAAAVFRVGQRVLRALGDAADTVDELPGTDRARTSDPDVIELVVTTSRPVAGAERETLLAGAGFFPVPGDDRFWSADPGRTAAVTWGSPG